MLVAIVAIAAALGSTSLVSSSLTVSAPSSGAAPSDRSGNGQRDGLGAADGAVPDGTTIFDDEVPGVANLDQALLRVLRRAAADAAGDGVELIVNSGWRSPAYEARLRREAIAEYGSEAEAARWVATGTTSAHVSGRAVDLGPSEATVWLSEHALRTGRARSTATNPGTTNRVPKPSITVALPCTPTPRRIQGCSADQQA